MDLSGVTEPQVISIESQQEERRQLLESAMSTVAAVKRFVANFDRLKEERDDFDRQLADSFAENETLRKRVNDVKDHHDQLSKTVETLADQMESIAARCIEAVTIIRAQLDKRSPTTQTDLRSTDDQSPATPIRGTLSAPAQLTDGRSAGEQPAESNNFETGSSSITEASRVVHVFTQYLTQSTSTDVHKTKSA